MTGGKDAQGKQDNTELFPEPVQPKGQPAAAEPDVLEATQKEWNGRTLENAFQDVITAQTEILNTINQIDESIKSQPNDSLKESFNKAMKETNAFYSAMLPPVTAQRINGALMKTAAAFLEWEAAERKRFFTTGEWETLKKEFPDITEESGANLYFCSLVKPILNNRQEVKRKIAEHEKANDCKLSFADLMNPDKKNGLTLIEKFLDELGAIDIPKKEPADDKKLRTAERAGTIQEIYSNRLAIPTAKEYLNACSLLERGSAYMRQINMDGLTFNNGKLYFKDYRAREVSEMELQDLKTKENIEKINLPFLQFLYTILFKEWEKSIQDQANGKPGEIPPVSKFYLPDILKARGVSSNAGQTSINAIKNDISALHNVVGVLKVKGYKNPSYYPVLLFEGYDTATNTISISSPYLLHVVKEIYSFSVRRTKEGEPRLRKDGTPQRIAVNSYLIHSDITKERNKAAVQNVFLLVQSIENRGGERGKLNEFSISAESLIERNPLLKYQLTKKNPAQTLKRCFVKTWELLEAETDLKEKYINIKLPDPRNPADIPTLKGLSDHVIKITHYGKANSKEADCNTKTQ